MKHDLEARFYNNNNNNSVIFVIAIIIQKNGYLPAPLPLTCIDGVIDWSDLVLSSPGRSSICVAVAAPLLLSFYCD